ncbi:probable beta-galactosidase [Cephalotrichum gorgonifer]|uniref:Probable beta-galactosidase n=1 Tax=Cephalotrichum gorgonifer TaxID=2041049 RepID=A0AAE8SX70_9PEZI|nr:probable beta-galactosidase [Cephalotrichum gorgonifer]
MACQPPRLVATEWSKQLHAKGKPFLVLGGELQNSSLTSSEYMDTIWQKMKDTNINTLLGCVTWEDIEPEEGVFNFSELDKVILGISSYTPAWVKKDIKRFPRAILRKEGGVLETSHTLSVFYTEAVKADAKAFSTLMAHLKEFDEAHSTVLMVQVENETGLLGDYRDGSEAAEKSFNSAVPQDLLEFLSSDYENLHVDMKALNLTDFNQEAPKGRTWTEVFGTNAPRVGELFQAYHYAKFLDEVAAAGKAAYDIPLYTNVWMNCVDLDSSANLIASPVGGGGLPGAYPSGGAVSNVLDIWQKFAPHLDFISPDIYLNDYTKTCARYRHRGQPLFIPEQRRDEYGVRRVWIAFGTYAAIGTAPFGIDTLKPETNPFTKHYGLLKSVSAIVLDAQRRPHSSVGFCFDELPTDFPATPDPSPIIVRNWGGFEVTIERCFVFGKPGTAAGMVIHRGGGKFLLIGWGFQVRAKALSKASHYTGILRFEEKIVEDVETGKLRTGRVLNGDETRSGQFGMVPNEDPDYGNFPICVTIPARTMIAEIEFYSLE